MDIQNSDDIPSDVLSIARGCIEPREFNAELPKNTVLRIARAILAAKVEEREACRWIAAFKGNNANMLQNDNVDPDTNRLVRDVSFEIADAIKNRS